MLKPLIYNAFVDFSYYADEMEGDEPQRGKGSKIVERENNPPLPRKLSGLRGGVGGVGGRGDSIYSPDSSARTTALQILYYVATM